MVNEEKIEYFAKFTHMPINVVKARLKEVAAKHGVTEDEIMRRIMEWYSLSKEEKYNTLAECVKRQLIIYDVGTKKIELTEKGRKR